MSHPGEKETEKNCTKCLRCCHKKAISDEYVYYESAVKCVTKDCNASLQSFVQRAAEKCIYARCVGIMCRNGGYVMRTAFRRVYHAYCLGCL